VNCLLLIIVAAELWPWGTEAGIRQSLGKERAESEGREEKWVEERGREDRKRRKC
jgi:hypothetical protein